MYIEFSINPENGDPKFYFPYEKIGLSISDEKIIDTVSAFIDDLFLNKINHSFAKLKEEISDESAMHSFKKNSDKMWSYYSADSQFLSNDILEKIKSKAYRVNVEEKNEQFFQKNREKIKDKLSTNIIYFFEK